MLAEILEYLQNYFVYNYETIASIGTKLTLTGDYVVGQYINIDGSRLNDGVYEIESIDGTEITLTVDLLAEETNCIVYGLKIPKTIIDLSAKIATYNTNSTQGLTSESQGSRSVSYKDGSTWTDVFKGSLTPYRRIYSDKYIRRGYNVVKKVL
jgi:hypothetical protein